MAKRRENSSMVSYQPAYRPPAPVIRIAAPRAIQTRAPKRRTRARIGGGGTSLKNRMIAGAIGGAALGFIEKSGFAANLPTIPLIGRKGTIALAAYYLGGQKPGILQDIALAAAILAGNELGRDGKISGEDD